MKKLVSTLLCAVGLAMSAPAQTINLTVTLSTGDNVTIPVTVGTPTVTKSTGGTGTTTPPPTGGTGTGTTTPPPANVPLSKVPLGSNVSPGGFLAATIPDFTQNISALPVDAAKTAAWQKEYCSPTCDHFHLDNTMPFSVVSAPATVAVAFTDSADSDNVKYPVSASTPTEGGAPIGQPCPAAMAALGVCTKGKVVTNSGDHHAIVINRDTGVLYEVYQLGVAASKFTGYAGEAWNLLAKDIRAPGRNSADAAGLPIYPLLVNYDEETAGSGGHAFRFTCNNTNSQFIYPATHSSGGSDTCYPGMRIRLRSSFTAPAGSSIRVVNMVNDLKTYGAFVADNGSNFYFTGVFDTRWTDDEMTALGFLNEGVFDVVNTGHAPQSPPQ